MENVRKHENPLKKTLQSMDMNDVFNYPSLGLVAFKRWKRGGKSFEAVQLEGAKQYNCRCTLATAIKTYDVIGMYTPPIKPNDIDKLQPGDLFVIPIRKDAVLLRFVERKPSGKVVACNPLEPSLNFNVDKSFTFTLVKNL